MNTNNVSTILGIVPPTGVLIDSPTDVVPLETLAAPVTALAPVADIEVKRLETDTEYGRESMRDMIAKGRTALDSAILLAQSGDAPRAYEVVATMITALIQANKELVTLHKLKKDAAPRTPEGSSVDGASVVIEKAVFVGRTQDLLREIREAAKASKDPLPSE